MDLFTYRDRIGELDKTKLGKLNEQGYLVTGVNGDETWISLRNYTKIRYYEEWKAH